MFEFTQKTLFVFNTKKIALLLFIIFTTYNNGVFAQACYTAFSNVSYTVTPYAAGATCSYNNINYTCTPAGGQGYRCNSDGDGANPSVNSAWVSNGACGGTPPTVPTTDAASLITASTATSGGDVTAGAGISARGIVYRATTSTPTLAHSVVTVAGTTGVFVANLTGLSASTTYYVRAYATNASGTTYGPEISFTTLAPVAPTVSTTAASGISCSSFNSGGNVTSDGGSPVTARGIVFGTGVAPTLANTLVTTGAGTGVYSSAGTGLTSSTTYYCRAYATNAVGTSYGPQISFTTSAAPCVAVLTTTDAASAITNSTATSGGNISSDAGSAVTARGVCYGTTSMPTVSGSKTTNGAGTGAFVSNLTGLSEGTTYYVRSYATNANGTGYGPEISFTTTALTRYYSCAGANTWSTTTDCAVLSAAPGNTHHAIVRHDWYDIVNGPTYNLANLAYGQLDAGNWFAAKPLKLTVKNGGRVVFTTSSYTALPAGFTLITESGGIFASYTSFATIQSVVNYGSLHFYGAVTNGNNITGAGEICYNGNFDNSTLGGAINGQFVSAPEATLNTGFFTTNNAILGGKCGSMSVLLPVELIEFTAVKSNEVVYVTWTTGAEINNDYFEVQVSSDGKNWETISVVQGAGNSSDINKYAIVDNDTKGYSIKYYRLKQADFDGTEWYSIIRFVNFKGTNNTNINAFDNGSSIVVQLNIIGNLNLEVFDVNGKLVHLENVNNISDNSEVLINKSELSTGLYFVKVTDKNQSYSTKVFIK